MNKKMGCVLLMGLSLIGGTILADQPAKDKGKIMSTNLKFRFVDSFALMRETGEGKEISQDLQEKYKEYALDIQKDNEELEKEAADYKRKEAMLSESARESEQKKLMKKKRELESKIQESEEDYKREANKATEQVFKEITEAVAETAKAEGLDAVFDMNSGRAIYVADAVNYTEKVKDGMDKRYEGKKKAQKDSGKKTATA